MLNYNSLNEGLNQIYSNAYEKYNECLDSIEYFDIDKKFINKQKNELNNLWNKTLEHIFKKSKNAFSYKYNDSSYDNRYEVIYYRNDNIKIKYYIVYSGCKSYNENHFEIFIDNELIAEIYKDSQKIIYKTGWLSIIENIINNMRHIHNIENEIDQIKQKCVDREKEVLEKRKKDKEQFLNNMEEIKDYI